MSILDEVQAVSKRQGGVCTVTEWLDDMEPKVRGEWVEVLASDPRTVRAVDVHKVMAAHGYTYGATTVRRHRRRDCMCQA